MVNLLKIAEFRKKPRYGGMLGLVKGCEILPASKHIRSHKIVVI